MDLLEWRRRKLIYEARERADRSNRVTVGDATPYHAGVIEQVHRELFERLEILESILKVSAGKISAAELKVKS